MQRFSDSDTGTQMIKGPSDAVGASFPSQGRHITLSVEPAIFMPQYQQHRTHDR